LFLVKGMTKAETLALAARHIESGKKIILGFRRQVPIGYVLRRWYASDYEPPQSDEIIDDQPLVVTREATYEEYVINRPAEFPPVIRKTAPAGIHFYEMKCE
jgi:hypothetical protein